MENSTFKDIIIPLLSVAISIWAIIKAYITDSKTNKLSEENTRLQNASVELEIRNLINSAKKELEEKVSNLRFFQEKEKKKILTEDEEIQFTIAKERCQNAKQEYLNAFEESCMKYLDEKVDKDRFKKTYIIELQNIVSSEAFKSFIDTTSSPYNAIKTVYTEWYNHEINS